MNESMTDTMDHDGNLWQERRYLSPIPYNIANEQSLGTLWAHVRIDSGLKHAVLNMAGPGLAHSTACVWGLAIHLTIQSCHEQSDPARYGPIHPYGMPHEMPHWMMCVGPICTRSGVPNLKPTKSGLKTDKSPSSGVLGDMAQALTRLKATRNTLSSNYVPKNPES